MKSGTAEHRSCSSAAEEVFFFRKELICVVLGSRFARRMRRKRQLSAAFSHAGRVILFCNSDARSEARRVLRKAWSAWQILSIMTAKTKQRGGGC